MAELNGSSRGCSLSASLLIAGCGAVESTPRDGARHATIRSSELARRPRWCPWTPAFKSTRPSVRTEEPRQATRKSTVRAGVSAVVPRRKSIDRVAKSERDASTPTSSCRRMSRNLVRRRVRQTVEPRRGIADDLSAM